MSKSKGGTHFTSRERDRRRLAEMDPLGRIFDELEPAPPRGRALGMPSAAPAASKPAGARTTADVDTTFLPSVTKVEDRTANVVVAAVVEEGAYARRLMDPDNVLFRGHVINGKVRNGYVFMRTVQGVIISVPVSLPLPEGSPALHAHAYLEVEARFRSHNTSWRAMQVFTVLGAEPEARAAE